MKYISLSLIGLLVGIYVAFVAMCLWNWFATRALHTPHVSFLEAIGLVWLIQLLVGVAKDDSGPNWTMLWTLIEVMVPDEKRDAFTAALQEYKDGTWRFAAAGALSDVAQSSILLVLGFILHKVLAW